MYVSHYWRLLAMTALSFIAMYVLMYAMVFRWPDVYPNVNQLYMAGLMTAPMIVIELLLMGGMYNSRNANIAIMISAVVAAILLFSLIRQQSAVGDVQFLRSMIPHHSGAILMCERAPVENTEIKALCETIIEGQQAEIEQMKKLLASIQ